MSELVLRPVVLGDDEDADERFIMDSWLTSLRKSPDSNLPDKFFFPAYRAIAKFLLVNSQVRVLVPKEEPSLILGYIVYDPGMVHWVYVKRNTRGNGLAKKMIELAGSNPVLTMTTPLGRKRLRWPVRTKVLRQKLNREL